MKRNVLLLGFLIALLSLSTQAFAQRKYYDFKSGGLYYKIASVVKKQVIVTSEQDMARHNGHPYSSNDNKPKGGVKVPKVVSYNGSVFNVVGIGQNAFLGCDDLTSVIVSRGVKSIGRKAFAFNEKLTSITLPKTLKSIGAGGFNGCVSLSSIKLPDGLENIGSYAFIRCTKLKFVEIPKTVTTFGSGVFEDCKGLRELKCLPVQPPVVNANIFSRVDKSKVKLYVPTASRAKYKQAQVWKDFTNILNVEEAYYTFKKDGIYYKVVADEKQAIVTSEQNPNINFGKAYSLSSNKPKGTIKIPKVVSHNGSEFKVVALGKYAFLGCSELTSIVLPEGMISIENYAFARNTKLKSIQFPKTLKNIGASVFNGCSSLTSIEFPEGLVGIKNYAFIRCANLSTVIIPASLTEFGYGVFQECKGLRELKCLPEQPPVINTNVFQGVDKSKVRLYVPTASLAKYKGAQVWKDFTNIKTLEQGMAVEALERLEVRVYPNPAQVFVEVTGLEVSQEVKLFNLEGLLLLSCRANAEGVAVIPVDHFAKGLYVLQGKNFSEKLIIR